MKAIGPTGLVMTSVQDAVKRADAAVVAKDYAKAVAGYKQAESLLAGAARDAEFDTILAEARRLLGQGSLQDALRQVDKALDSRPSDGQAVALKEKIQASVSDGKINVAVVEAQSLHAGGRRQDAPQQVDKALDSGPSDGQAVALEEKIQASVPDGKINVAVAEAQSLHAGGRRRDAPQQVDEAPVIPTTDSVTLGLKTRIEDALDVMFSAALADARRLHAAGKRPEALQKVRDALAIRPADGPALALKEKIQEIAPLTLTLDNGVTMKLTHIKAGTFMMGSPKTETDGDNDEGPQRQVTISKPFYMGVTAVTQAQWKAAMNTQPWDGQPYTNAAADHDAASHISWDDAIAFCAALTKNTGCVVRLATEVEWEYACRAGTTTVYSFGDDPSKLGEYAWFQGNAESEGEHYPHAVGTKKPNLWGLYDMHGNVWEWCADWHTYSYPNADVHAPKSSATGMARVLRGGSWGSHPYDCSAASRLRTSPDFRSSHHGFRVVVEADSGED